MKKFLTPEEVLRFSLSSDELKILKENEAKKKAAEERAIIKKREQELKEQKRLKRIKLKAEECTIQKQIEHISYENSTYKNEIENVKKYPYLCRAILCDLPLKICMELVEFNTVKWDLHVNQVSNLIQQIYPEKTGFKEYRDLVPVYNPKPTNLKYKMRVFCHCIVEGLNLVSAAWVAGYGNNYSTSGTKGSLLYRNPEIKSYIQHCLYLRKGIDLM